MIEATHVGLNLIGNVVLYCDRCQDTFAVTVQTMTLKELLALDAEHKCKSVIVEKPV